MREERPNCFLCGEEISHNNTFTKEGWKEVEISKMCEECFDKTTLSCETMDNAQKFIESHKILKRISKECDGVILGGGIFRNFVDPKDKIEDIDLFFKCSSSVEKVINILKEGGYQCIFECEAGELFSYRNDHDKIQLICKSYYDSVKDAIGSFDLSPCRAGVELDTEIFYFCKTFISSVLNKKMKVVNLEYPVATLKRILKYNIKGYSIRSESLRDLVWLINELELNEDNMEFYID